MKKTAFYLILLLGLSYLTSCTPRVIHADPFYNYDDFSMIRIPLINPIEVNRLNSLSPWDMELHPAMWIDFPKSQGLYYLYGHVHDPEKFAVKNGTIMAYSSYVDNEADVYIQENYYHWFVNVPDKKSQRVFTQRTSFSNIFKRWPLETLIGKRQMKRICSLGELVVWSGYQTVSNKRQGGHSSVVSQR
jgi:hypothetical protein